MIKPKFKPLLGNIAHKRILSGFRERFVNVKAAKIQGHSRSVKHFNIHLYCSCFLSFLRE